MEYNREDAEKAKRIGLEKMEAGDFVRALKFLTKAQRLFPDLEHLLHMIAICEVHSSAMNKIKGLDNLYGILQVQPFADADTIKKQFKKLALLLHPDKNIFAGAEAAFKLVGEANSLLSDQIKRSQYDVLYKSHSALANKHPNANSDRRSAATNNGQENKKKSADDSAPKKEEGCPCTKNDAEGRKPQNGEAGTKISAGIPKTDILEPHHQVKEPDTSAANSMPGSSARKMKNAAKRRKKAVEESSKSSEVDISDATKTKTHTNENSKRKSSRKKPQVLNAKRGCDADFVSPPNKKTRSGSQYGCEFNLKQTSEGNKSTEQADPGVSSASSQADKGKAKENANSGNGEDAALLSRIDKVERKAEKFAANQVWSVIDSRDGMPRKYVLVEEVLNADFKLRITYLEPVRDDDSTPVGCGKFENGKTDVVEDRSFFSCQMHYVQCNEIVTIYPRTGEIWAIFREWNTSLEKDKLPYMYDIVEIVNDFHDVLGIGVAYMGKQKGYVSLFHREPKDQVCQIQFHPEDILRFSHKIPALKMTRKGEECVPANSYELVRAALPKHILQVDMETDSEILER